MRLKNWMGGAAVSALSLVSLAPLASAQVTTSGVRGVVTGSDGVPVSGATVTVTDTRTGTRRVTISSASGQFDVRNLEVGGPYSVRVEAEGEQTTRLDEVQLSLGQVADITLTLVDDDTSEEIIVTASAATVGRVAIGPSASYNLETLQTSPAANRDIKDIIRMDPRVYMDEAFVNAISCAGANPRFNSLTVDGVRLNDNFGLNSNGYPTERIPFSFDAIRQVSVELAPFDVQYGSFTSCNINAVTKSGTNEFHGSAFFDYTSDGLTSHNTDGINRDIGNFEEKRYGLTFGGPIVQDRLFFFAAYEKFEGANIFGRVPADVGLADAVYQGVIDTAVNTYGYVAGGNPTSLPVTDEKLLARIDWNITDRHRAVFTYNYNDGFNYNGSDDSSTQFPDGNHYYERGAELNDYTAAVFSDWTDNFSTEARVSYLKLDNRQIPFWSENFGEIQVRVPTVTGGAVTVYLGPDDSRHSNVLNYELWNYRVAGTLRLGNHAITAGYEREEFDVFNLFIQQSKGEWRFSSPAEFAAGDFNYFQYTNAAGSNDVNDGAARFGYQINTVYVQDEWQPVRGLDIVAGLRYDWYESDDHPSANAGFLSSYGFSNDANMDGRDILQPRIGITYDVTDALQLHGGVGLFGGGNPNVWISNNYSNNGVTLADYFCQTPASATAASRCNFSYIADNRVPNLSDFTYGGDGRPFYNVPQEAIDAIANANGVGGVNALDPDFELPSEWKFSIGAVWDIESIPWLGSNWRVYADYLYSKTNEAAIVLPIGYVQTGTAPDGRPIYGGNSNDFVLTNAADKGYTSVWSINVQKSYDNGIDWALGYAYTDAQDANPMTSSVAFSNFSNFATSDPRNVTTATSDYEIAHRFTLRFNWEKDFIDDHPTRLSLFGSVNEGAPYSYTFAFNNMFETPFRSSRQLAYIPTGIDDPLIAPTSNMAAVQALVDYIGRNDTLRHDYRGRIAERNIGVDDWWTKVDLRLSQSFPGFMGGDSFEGFLVINNLTNLLNKRWGVLREHGFPGNAELYTASIESGRYRITSFNAGADNDSIVVTPSLWQVHVGLSYKF